MDLVLMAEGGSTAIDAVKTIFTSITSEFSVGTIASIIGIGVGAAVGLVVVWFGARKLGSMVMSAFSKGKLKV